MAFIHYGCEISVTSHNIISIKELYNNSILYNGKKITTQGYIKKDHENLIDQPYYSNLCNSNKSHPAYCVLLYIPNNITIIKGYYQVTGIMGFQINNTIIRIDILKVKLIE